MSSRLTNMRNIRFQNVMEQLGRELHLRMVKKFSYFQNGIRMMGSFLGKECSPIFAQRVFRSYRMLQLHSKLWANSFGMQNSNSRQLLLSFVLFSLCQPKPSSNSGEIEEAELVEHVKDLDFIHELTAATVVCPDCKDRLVVYNKIKHVQYCHCPNASSAYDKKIKGYSWTPFVETADLLIWRQPYPDRPGLFMYKVYGYYDDISPEDFLSTQLDIDYRKKWDDTVLKLEFVEVDKSTNSEIIYWEMKWPTMFSNRDYLFTRRHMVDLESNNIIIMSRAVTHAKVPERKGIHRVNEYWSVMQVKAVTGMKEPGVEFGLTYYDNPGLSLPGWMNNWAAMSAIPDFLDKQRNAARAKRKLKGKKITVSNSHCSDQGSTQQNESDSSNNNNTSTNNSNSANINPSTDPKTPPPPREILSQFFKAHFLEVF